MATENATLKNLKTQARKAARIRRKAAQSPRAAQDLISQFPFDRFAPQTVGGIWPLKNEVDPRPLLHALAQRGFSLCLPCTPDVGAPLTFRQWREADDLKVGPYDTREPFPEQPELFPSLVLVPLLAFTASGARLGYGGGFYDRTLSALKSRHDVFACGVAFAAQEAPDLPTDAYDQRLNGILTEKYFKAFT